MKLIKITSLGCPSCIIMNNLYDKIKDNYNYEVEELDYDFDDVEKYNPGKTLPVFIKITNKEEKRLVGEKTLEELKSFLD